MSLDASNFEERIESVSPSTAGFNTRTGRATMSLFLRVNMTATAGYTGSVLNEDTNVFPIDLLSAPQTILGGVNTDISADGRLNRVLPFAHPQWPFLYANNIANVHGIGAPTLVTSISPLEATPMPAFALYPVYEFVVEFTNRDYAVLPDEDMETQELTWTDVDKAELTATVAWEWLRYTYYQSNPQNDWITASIGNGFTFQTFSGAEPKGAVYAGMPRVLLPNEVIKLTWTQVPYRYYSSPNSFLRRFRGRINQFAWYDWDVGELLYLNCNPIRYTPPILQAANWLLGSTTVEKWCDMEMYFLATRRDGVDLPTPANANFIAAGHNLVPWQQNNLFYYAANATSLFPQFTSFPFELLFTDPDIGEISPGDAGNPEIITADDV